MSPPHKITDFKAPTLAGSRTITFGIEFEMIVTVRPSWVESREDEAENVDLDTLYSSDMYGSDIDCIRNFLEIDPEKQLVTGLAHLHVAEKLQAAGLPSTTIATDTSKWSVIGDTSLSMHHTEEKARNFYLFGLRPSEAGNSVDPTENDLIATNWFYEDSYEAVAVEVRTPILEYNADSFRQVWHAVETFKCLAYGVDDPAFRMVVNESCGLHVHVGSKGPPHRSSTSSSVETQNLGFPLRTVKNLLEIVCCFQHQMSSLHPPHRIKNKLCLANRIYYPDIRDRFIPNGHAPTNKAIIDGIETLEHMIYNRNVAVNLQSVFFEPPEQPGELTGTIEFRQHCATLDPEAVWRWADLVCNLLVRSHQAGESGFPLSFLKLSEGYNSTAPQLFRELGLPRIAEYYGRRGLFNHVGPFLHHGPPYRSRNDSNDDEDDRPPSPVWSAREK